MRHDALLAPRRVEHSRAAARHACLDGEECIAARRACHLCPCRAQRLDELTILARRKLLVREGEMVDRDGSKRAR